MYSQHDEEKVITEFFTGITGKFIDIGAYNGKDFSNTLRLLELGWSGVMVEPCPGAFCGLLDNTEPHWERVDLLNMALTVEGGIRVFWDFRGDAVGTLDEAHRVKWECGGKVKPARKFLTNTLPIGAFLKQYGPASFINLDVEGTNWELFQHLPFGWPELMMICVEYDDQKDAMLGLAETKGWKKKHETPENLLLIRK